jgi:hypothetical protein
MQCFSQIIHPFVGNYMAKFLYLMHTWRAVITGSCALQMLTGGDLISNNLNVIFPMGSLEVLEEFIVVSLKYQQVDTVTQPNYAFRAVVQSFAKYQHG